MKTCAQIICAAIVLSALSAHSQLDYSGTTYEIEIDYNNGNVASSVCMTLHEGGRFTMSDDALTMLWAPQAQAANQFMAVTAPGERTFVPYHLGVHGTLLPDKTVTGRGIDHGGGTFTFNGQSNDNCDVGRSQASLDNPIHTRTGSSRLLVGTLARQAMFDALRGQANVVADTRLNGRSFRLTLGTSDNRVLEYCWTFEENRSITTLQDGTLHWSPAGIARESTPFQSVGAGENGRGMAYHGALIGDDLLQVYGIEARDGEAVVTYGYGQSVSTCK